MEWGKVKASWFDKTAESTKELGKTIPSTALAMKDFHLIASMLVITSMENLKELENISGPTEKLMKANGPMD